MPDKVTATIRAEDLPKSLAAKLSKRPIPGTRYRVTAEPVEETEKEKLASLRADLQEGIDALDAGHWEDGEAVLARFKEKYQSQ